MGAIELISEFAKTKKRFWGIVWRAEWRVVWRSQTPLTSLSLPHPICHR